MWSTSYQMSVHVNDTYVETQLPSTFDAESCGGKQLHIPARIAPGLLQRTSGCNEKALPDTLSGVTGPYCPGALLVQSATLLDREDGSERSTAEAVGASKPMQELATSETTKCSTDCISAICLEPYVLSPAQFPTIGSISHLTGHCKPCAFTGTKRCKSGYECQFCHLCAPGEKKRRRREKVLYCNQQKRD